MPESLFCPASSGMSDRIGPYVHSRVKNPGPQPKSRTRLTGFTYNSSSRSGRYRNRRKRVSRWPFEKRRARGGGDSWKNNWCIARITVLTCRQGAHGGGEATATIPDWQF